MNAIYKRNTKRPTVSLVNLLHTLVNFCVALRTLELCYISNGLPSYRLVVIGVCGISSEGMSVNRLSSAEMSAN